MNRLLLDYLPQVLQKVREYKEINAASQPEIEAAWDAVDLVLNNQFLETATEEGVRRYEEELAITPAASDTLETRKERIRSLWIFSVVYTFPWLIKWLGDISAAATASVTDYTLNITLPSSCDYDTVLDTLRAYISAAIVIVPKILLREVETKYYTGAAFRHSVITELQTPAWDTSSFVLLTDENDKVLYDGSGAVLYEEA